MFPQRPVLPMRWTYSSMLLGRSKFTTCCTSGMSRPRAATDVATRTGHLPERKSARACSRSRCSRSLPDSTTTLLPALKEQQEHRLLSASLTHECWWLEPSPGTRKWQWNRLASWSPQTPWCAPFLQPTPVTAAHGLRFSLSRTYFPEHFQGHTGPHLHIFTTSTDLQTLLCNCLRYCFVETTERTKAVDIYIAAQKHTANYSHPFLLVGPIHNNSEVILFYLQVKNVSKQIADLKEKQKRYLWPSGYQEAAPSWRIW